MSLWDRKSISPPRPVSVPASPVPPGHVATPPRPDALLCLLNGRACEDVRCAWKVGDKCAVAVIANELYVGVDVLTTQTSNKG